MKYLEYLNTNVAIDIRDNKEDAKFNSTIISDEEANRVISAWEKHKIVKFLGDKIVFFEDEVNKRINIVNERNDLLKVAENFVDKPTYFKHLSLTAEDINNAEEYYLRLLDLPQAYDDSADKQIWSYSFVDKYTSAKNSNNYQLLKPSFIK